MTNPQEQLRTVVLQNGSWNTAIFNPSPQYVTANGLRWEHSPELIFPGGNEYRKFETLDVNHTTMGLERMGWDGERFHAYVFPDEPRPNYVYDESAKGSFLIRNSDNVENDRASDYLWVHFTLETNPSTNPIYLYGDWTCQRLLPQYRMEYDQRDQRYHAAVLLKQGYYSYTYMEQLPDGTLRYLPSEGNFHETENIYQVLIYYRAWWHTSSSVSARENHNSKLVKIKHGKQGAKSKKSCAKEANAACGVCVVTSWLPQDLELLEGMSQLLETGELQEQLFAPAIDKLDGSLGVLALTFQPLHLAASKSLVLYVVAHR